MTERQELLVAGAIFALVIALMILVIAHDEHACEAKGGIYRSGPCMTGAAGDGKSVIVCAPPTCERGSAAPP